MNLTGEQLLCCREFAARLGVSTGTVKRRALTRRVTVVRIGPDCRDLMGRDRRMVRIPLSELDRMANVLQRIPDKRTVTP